MRREVMERVAGEGYEIVKYEVFDIMKGRRETASNQQQYSQESRKLRISTCSIYPLLLI